MLRLGADEGEALSDLGWALTAFVAAFFVMPVAELCWNRWKAPRRMLEEENATLAERVLALENERHALMNASTTKPVRVEAGDAYFVTDAIGGSYSDGNLYCALPDIQVVNPDDHRNTVELLLAIIGKKDWMITEPSVDSMSLLVISRVSDQSGRPIESHLGRLCDVRARGSQYGALFFRVDGLMLTGARRDEAACMALVVKNKMTGHEQQLKLPTALTRLADIASQRAKT
jgi:hypothetical protein